MSIFLGAILAIISLIFAFQNNELITVKFFKWQIDSSIALIVLATLIIGFMVSFLMLTPGMIRSNMKLRRLKQENEKLSEKINSSGISYESEGLGEEGDFRK